MFTVTVWLRRVAVIGVVVIACGLATAGEGSSSSANADPTPAGGTVEKVELRGAARVRADAEKLKGLAVSHAAKKFLAATEALPDASERVLYVNRETRTWYTPGEREKLNEEERAALTERKLDGEYYYSTRYGSPLAYVRAIDLLAQRGGKDGGFAGEFAFTRKRILDYGYGTIGHLRLMASLGADVLGIDTDPSLARLYASNGDTGSIAGFGGHADGCVRVRTGRFPVDRECMPTGLLDVVQPPNLFNPPVGSITMYRPIPFDLFISKNTLKRGYVHPEPTDGKPVDKRMLVDLGTGDESFLKAVHEVLKPGGLFMIYNLSPAPSKPGEAYKPWSDGRCPFTREQLEAAGFEVIAFDETDDAKAREMGRLLGWADDPDGDGPEKGMDLENDLFSHWMLARKK